MQVSSMSKALLSGFSPVYPRPRRLVCRAEQSNNKNHNERNNYNVRKGKQFENARRRRGRPAHLRSPYDSPLRDGNRDRLIGLLTERAAKTLMIYLMETNANVYSWLLEFYKKHPIPRNGSWDEVSGEAFLRQLLSMPIEEAKFNTGRDSLFDNVTSCGVDPRSIAQRIMDIRTQLSEEFIQELQAIAEENSLLLRETLQTSLSSSLGTLEDTKPAPEGASDSPAAGTAAKGDSRATTSSSSKSGSATTPPPSPAPSAPASKPEPVRGVSSSSSSSSDKKSAGSNDKAATIASLNAALKASPAPGSGSSSIGSSSHPELAAGSSSSDDKLDMADVLAQLRRAMDADVARDVLKMKETTADSSSGGTAAPEAAAVAAAAAADVAPLDADVAAPSTSSSEGLESSQPPAGEEEEDVQPAPADAPKPAAAAAAAVESDTSDSLSSPPADADSSSDEDSSSSNPGSLNSQLSSSTVGEAGTYSRMLPKGWGPRLGVGFSRYPRSRNNIVSSANLGVSKAAAPAGGDALSGSGVAGEAV